MPASRSGVRGSATASAAGAGQERGHDRRAQLQPVPEERREHADRHRAPREAS